MKHLALIQATRYDDNGLDIRVGQNALQEVRALTDDMENLELCVMRNDEILLAV